MENTSYQKKITVRWADVDMNGHMKSTAYLEYCFDIRMTFLNENGFPISNFQKLQSAPVILKDEIQYFKEVFLFDELVGSLILKDISEDEKKFSFLNQFYKNNELVASVYTNWVWFHVPTRKDVPAPEALLSTLKKLVG